MIYRTTYRLSPYHHILPSSVQSFFVYLHPLLSSETAQAYLRWLCTNYFLVKLHSNCQGDGVIKADMGIVLDAASRLVRIKSDAGNFAIRNSCFRSSSVTSHRLR